MMMIIIIKVALLSLVFFPLVLSFWTNGEPHHLGFKLQIVALSLWSVMFLVRWFYVQNLLNAVMLLLLLFLFLFSGENNCQNLIG
jgi:hypothetical protein